MELRPEIIARLTGGELFGSPKEGVGKTKNPSISIDSRTISPDNIFWALQGDRFDGHDFVEEAFNKGAQAAVVSRDFNYRSVNGLVIRVDDTLKALQGLATAWRSYYPCPLVAVTGSSGKTTTKELITHILSQRYKCLSTEKNLNNHIGVPLTLLRLNQEHEVGVLELGMNHRGEIALLTSIVRPRIGVITNVGKAHIGFLDSLDGVLEAKAELLDGMGQEGVAILNRDSPFFNLLASRCKNGLVCVGESVEADIRLLTVKLRPEEGKTEIIFKVKDDTIPITLPVLGRFIAYNVLMAVAVALELGCGYDEIDQGISHFTPMPGRMYHRVVDGIHILDDTYNANPESLHMALKTLSECKGSGRSMAIIGDMMELGSQSECLHRQLGQWLGFRKKVDFIITYGVQAEIVAKEAIRSGYPPQTIWSLQDHEEVSELAYSIIHEKDWILIKGSRQMGLDRVSDRLADIIKTRKKIQKAAFRKAS